MIIARITLALFGLTALVLVPVSFFDYQGLTEPTWRDLIGLVFMSVFLVIIGVSFLAIGISTRLSQAVNSLRSKNGDN